jgi:hypothetical protein
MPLLDSSFFNSDSTPAIFKKIAKIFLEVDKDENANQGTSFFDPPVDSQLSPSRQDHSLAANQQAYGNLKRYVNFEETNKTDKLNVYRQMAEYPEIGYALNMICEELINRHDLTGDVANMEITNDKISKNMNMVANIRKEWEYVYHDLFDFNRKAKNMFRSYLITGELFYEKVVNEKNKKDGLRRVRKLLPDQVFPVWDHNDEVVQYNISYGSNDVGEVISLYGPQVAYAHNDIYTLTKETGSKVILSYLERAKKIWRQLQLLEEAVVIYRLVRAPERRIFRIATGNMPKQAAEQYLQKLMRQYRQKKIYNTSTGEIDGQNNILAMLEDFWFTEPADGNGSNVDTLPGGENLGEINDLNWFLTKLYMALEIPTSRRLETVMGQPQYNMGQMGEITWQEVKFVKMVEGVEVKIMDLVFDVFKTHLKLKGLWNHFGLKDQDFKLNLNKNNHFEELKRTQIEEMRLNAFGTVSAYLNDVFSKEFACKHYLGWTDEEYRQNKSLIEKEKADNQEDGGGGFGGF